MVVDNDMGNMEYEDVQIIGETTQHLVRLMCLLALPGHISGPEIISLSRSVGVSMRKGPQPQRYKSNMAQPRRKE